MKALIVDDELNARGVMEALLVRSKVHFETVLEAEGVTEAISILERETVDFLFLDIRMNDGNGFDVLEQVSRESWKYLIFTTAFDEYAIKAFKFSASDYLLKPLGVGDLDNALDRCLGGKQADQDLPTLSKAIHTRNFETITLPTATGFQKFRLEDILYILADINYSLFHFEDGSKLLVARTLKYYEDLLANNNFIRPHRSYLVNVMKIKEVPKTQGNIRLLCDSELPISRRKMREVRDLFKSIKTTLRVKK